MRHRIAKVDQQTITEQLGNMSIVALDHAGTHPLIGTHHVPPVFRVELGGESGGIDQVAEHDGQLPSFSLWSLRRLLSLGSRRWCCLSRLRGICLSACCVTSPNETSAFVIDNWVHIEEFVLQIVEIVVIEGKASLEGTIRYPSLAFQEVDDLGEDVIEGH